jgi:hypothetical protein
MSANRCSQCGIFVPKAAELATFSARGADGVWRTFSRLLCHECRRSALIELPWRHPGPHETA